MTAPRFTIAAFAVFVLAFTVILWGARGFPALTERAPAHGAAR